MSDKENENKEITITEKEISDDIKDVHNEGENSENTSTHEDIVIQNENDEETENIEISINKIREKDEEKKDEHRKEEKGSIGSLEPSSNNTSENDEVVEINDYNDGFDKNKNNENDGIIIESEEDGEDSEEEGLIDPRGIVESFDMFRRIGDVAISQSLVRLICDRTKLLQTKKQKWDDLDLFRVMLYENGEDKTGFNIFFQNTKYRNGEPNQFNVPMSEIEDIFIYPKINAFQLKHPKYHFHFQFQNDHDYSTFESFMRMILKDFFQKLRKNGGWSSSYNPSATISTLFKTTGGGFFQKHYREWSTQDALMWMKHIFYQKDSKHFQNVDDDDDQQQQQQQEEEKEEEEDSNDHHKPNDEITTLYEKCSVLKCLKHFEQFFKRCEKKKLLIILELKKVLQMKLLSSTQKREQEKQNEEEEQEESKEEEEKEEEQEEGEEEEQENNKKKNEEQIEGKYSSKLKTIFEKEKSLKFYFIQAIEDLDDFGYRFNHNYYYVLKKRIESKSKPRPDPITREMIRIYPNLTTLRRYLRFVKPSWWNVEECSFELLFLLLFNKSFNNYLDEKEEEFEEFRYQMKNSMDFKELLNQFNGKHGIHLEWLSFDLNIQIQIYNFIQKTYRLEQEKQQLQEELKTIESQFLRTQKLLERYQLLGKYEKMIKDIQNRLNEQEIELKDKQLEVFPRIEEIDEEILRLGIRTRKYQSLDQNETLKDRFHWTFQNHRFRTDEIKKLIKGALENWKQKTGRKNFVLTVKLVLGQLLSAPGALHKWFAKYLLPIVGGDFYKYGFVHASVVIKNCQVHWFNSSLIHFKELKAYDKYREFFCCDVDCPLVMDYDGFSRRIRNLAETMVRWNTFYRYVPFKVLPSGILKSSTYQKNCQEFTLEILDALGASKWHDEIYDYLKQLKKKLEEEKKVDCYQWFTVDKSFFQRYREAYEAEGSPPYIKEGNGNKELYTVYFRHHRELDDFVNNILEQDPNFPTSFVGKWILLKGFDRGYILRERKDSGNLNFLPSSRGCPFSRRMKSSDSGGGDI